VVNCKAKINDSKFLVNTINREFFEWAKKWNKLFLGMLLRNRQMIEEMNYFLLFCVSKTGVSLFIRAVLKADNLF
jgi:hypothetical protein